MYQNIDVVEAKQLLQSSGIVPLVRLLPLNFDTSLSVFMKVGARYLLESAESGEAMGRYSFLAIQARRMFILGQDKVEDWKTKEGDGDLYCANVKTYSNPLEYVREIMQCYNVVEDRYYHLPPFWGGLIGYLGYECVGYFERIDGLHEKPSLTNIPDGILIMPRELLVIDHLKRQLWLIGYIEKEPLEQSTRSLEQEYQIVEERLEALVEKVISPIPSIAWEYEAQIRVRAKREQANQNTSIPEQGEHALQLHYHTDKETFMGQVSHCIECIRRGDIIQVVPSRQLSLPFDSREDLLFYLRLRNINPSPYMYFLRFDTFTVIGSSPESMVSLNENREMSIKPIAGTIRRGKTKAEELALRQDLISDTKELAEHLMLVDLARNDLHRIAVPGTVHVPTYMSIERYSHVSHIVSKVSGILQPKYDLFDLIRATFPAGTLSGAPKIEAMNIIARIEPYKRNIYGGMIVAIGFQEYIDSCIVIRTALVKDNTVYLQAGAGIVADSDEQKEWQETQLKMGSLVQSLIDINPRGSNDTSN